MLLLKDISTVSIEATSDVTLRAYSHSMLNAIATCPTAGLMRYVKNKTPALSSSRAMALEAGSAAHQTYAAARLWQLRLQGLTEHAAYHGARLFGVNRHDAMVEAAMGAGDDKRNAMLRFCLEAFYSSGFYDDPSDKRRTFVNVEEALIAYLDRLDYTRNVWVLDPNTPSAMVGIEIPIDITITFEYVEETSMHDGDGNDLVNINAKSLSVRFIGTADGLTYDRDGETLRLEENKTASRLGEAWAAAFQMSHQVTGYLLGISTQLGMTVNKAGIHGMCIPLPRSYDSGGLMTEVVRRNDTQYKQFLEWMLHLVQIIDLYGDDPMMNAPKHTGACNKYFRSCEWIPLCASDEETKLEMQDLLEERSLTPTEQAMDDG